MSDTGGQRPDPVEAEIENALQPGRFVPDRACFRFVDRLEQVAARIGRLVTGESARAATLYESFLAGCYEKAEEVDDSSGSFGTFAQTLICGWITARQAAGARPQQTASRLSSWMDTDQYGFCHQLERQAATALDAAGLAAFTDQIQARFDAAEQSTAACDGSDRANQHARRRWAQALRTLHATRNDPHAYLALAQQTGLTAEDCLSLANMLTTQGDPAQALSWVERGLALDAQTSYGSFARHDLAELKPRLLADLGRGEQALETAWADYRTHPSRYAYDHLMAFVPEPDRSAWHHKAITAAMESTYLPPVVELLLHTDETEQLAQLSAGAGDDSLKALSHHLAEPAATILEQDHPDQAARIWRAQAMRILKLGKSRYYEAALRYFQRAKYCYRQAGQPTQWQHLVDEVYAQHRRKTSFLARFDDIVSGSEPAPKPSFLDRAKSRWAVPHNGQ
jgi:tetratricopeptide (TPR) repeat protein